MSSHPLPPVPPSVPKQPRPAPPNRRPPSRTVIVTQKPSHAGPIFACIFAAAVLGGGGYFLYKELNKPREPEHVIEAPEKPLPAIVAEPEKDETPKEDAVPRVVEEPKKKDEPATPKEMSKEALPPLPALDLTTAKAALTVATIERVKDGRWEEHAAQLEAAARAAVARRNRSAGPRMLDSAFEKDALPTALAQLAIVNRLSPEAFSEWTKKSPAFAGSVLTSRVCAELLVNNLTKEDSPADVLRVWEMLEGKAVTAGEKAKYRNLSLALALIYDRAGGDKKAGELYDYYVAADAKRRLYTDFSKISPDELVWGVAEGVFGVSGFEWALQKLRHSAARLGDAYAQIPYRINHPPYPSYTPENILKMGGVCQQQAEFCESNARARAVPAAYVGGEGSRGGHAWVAMRTDRGWAVKIGRYDDGYACGHARNPQTGKYFREWDFFLFDDSGRRNGNREAELNLIRAAALFPATEDWDTRMELLEAAARRNPGNPAAWRGWLDALLAGKAERPVAFWQKIVTEYRVALKENPDFFDISDRIETEKIFPKQEPERVGEMLRKRRYQSIRDNPARFDLLLESIRREAKYYKKQNDAKRIGSLYNNSFRTYGDHLPTFLGLSNDFAELSKDSPEIRGAAISVMEEIFNKKIDSKLAGDAFRLPMEARVCGKLAQLYSLDGNARKAERYAKRAEEIAAAGKTKRSAMR